MNFIKLKRIPIANVEEYITVNMDKVLTIEVWNECLRICFGTEVANILVENCEENGAILESEIGINPFKDKLCSSNS